MSVDEHRSILAVWPTLMSLETACHYLSLDTSRFEQLTQTQAIDPVVVVDQLRWRKADLDSLVKRLPVRPTTSNSGLGATPVLGVEHIDKIARMVADLVARTSINPGPRLVSIKVAGEMLGVGRSTIYRLMETGALPKHRIGSRTLISRSDLERMIADR